MYIGIIYPKNIYLLVNEALYTIESHNELFVMKECTVCNKDTRESLLYRTSCNSETQGKMFNSILRFTCSSQSYRMHKNQNVGMTATVGI